MPARDALWMGTRGGADVLGRQDIGEIAPGKAADLAVFDVSGLEFAGALCDPVAALLFCGSRRAKHVVVNGELVVEDGRLSLVDEGRLASRANALARRLLNG